MLPFTLTAVETSSPKYKALVPKCLRKFIRLKEIVTLLKQSGESATGSLFIHSITKFLVAEPEVSAPATRNPTTGHAAQSVPSIYIHFETSPRDFPIKQFRVLAELMEGPTVINKLQRTRSQICELP
jgi:hypothetical protein